MIIGTLSTSERYYRFGEGFKKAFEFLKNNDIEGFEYLGYTSLERAGKPIALYDPKADAVFFEKECQYILLQKGDIAIVFPEDAHMPQKRALVPTPVRKACIKVLVE